MYHVQSLTTLFSRSSTRLVNISSANTHQSLFNLDPSLPSPTSRALVTEYPSLLGACGPLSRPAFERISIVDDVSSLLRRCSNRSFQWRTASFMSLFSGSIQPCRAKPPVPSNCPSYTTAYHTRPILCPRAAVLCPLHIIVNGSLAFFSFEPATQECRFFVTFG